MAGGVADTLLSLAGDDPWFSLVIVYATAAPLTEFVTNNAAAVIVLPFALATPEHLGVNPVPYVVSVMIAASASFATPIGYQTNLRCSPLAATDSRIFCASASPCAL